jgi:hypothetical protein
MFGNIESIINKTVSRSLSNVIATYSGVEFEAMFDVKPYDELGVQGNTIRLRYLSSQLATQPSDGDDLIINSEVYTVARPAEKDNEFIVLSLHL